MKAPIHSLKHYVQKTLTTVTAGAVELITLANAVAPDAVNAGNEVVEGAVVKAIFVEMWARGQDTSPGSVLMTLLKVPDGQVPSFADMTDLHSYKNKRNVLYHTQGLTNVTGDSAIPFIRQWFKIPKGKQRCALGDNLQLVISAQALDTNICGFATYKEYT